MDSVVNLRKSASYRLDQPYRNCILQVIFMMAGVLAFQQAQAQCFPDRHSTSWMDGWISCEEFPSPNPLRENGHWILYDLKEVYALFNTHVWNSNDPSHLERGFREVAIDYSRDGQEWTELGLFDWPQANGSSYYEGFEGPDFTGVTARYVLMTGLSNYGGECFGLSEVRFAAEVQEESVLTATDDMNDPSCAQMHAFPNPFEEETKVVVQSTCVSTGTYRVVDMLGRVMEDGTLSGHSGFNEIVLSGRDWPSGTYVVHLQVGRSQLQQQLLKAE